MEDGSRKNESYQDEAAGAENSVDAKRANVNVNVGDEQLQGSGLTIYTKERLRRLTLTMTRVVSELRDAIRDKAHDNAQENQNLARSMYNQARKRQKTVIAAEFEGTINLKDDSLMDDIINIDKFPLGEDKKKVRELSVEARLGGWKFQRRRRIDGSYDTYFKHLPSKSFFRSIGSVVDFILYEINPKKRSKRPKGRPPAAVGQPPQQLASNGEASGNNVEARLMHREPSRPINHPLPNVTDDEFQELLQA